MQRPQPGQFIDATTPGTPLAPDEVQNGYYVPPPSPPPPPSARRMAAQYEGPVAHPFPDPQYVDPNAATAEAAAGAEANPFKKPSRLRSLLKRPSREFMVRGAVAAVAAALGFGVGAKPWKPTPAPVVVVRAPVAKKPVVAPRAAANRAVIPTSTRRVAVTNQQAAPVAAKARTATKTTAPATTTAKKATATKSTATVKPTTKVAAKPVVKPATKATAKATTTAKASGTTK